ncbi:hypothetical protein E2C01_071450 [Portunus trituberculatus]|uniref:Uncharacterized protein n=1 Tax=Portunus trituberculatus TaxID=210409 RepID=A0A5B7I003_PORTR|nr:hypothetical protein [Portunus trituberculatus]
MTLTFLWPAERSTFPPVPPMLLRLPGNVAPSITPACPVLTQPQRLHLQASLSPAVFLPHSRPRCVGSCWRGA